MIMMGRYFDIFDISYRYRYIHIVSFRRSQCPKFRYTHTRRPYNTTNVHTKIIILKPGANEHHKLHIIAFCMFSITIRSLRQKLFLVVHSTSVMSKRLFSEVGTAIAAAPCFAEQLCFLH